MEIANPFTGETIDTDQDPKEWAGTAMDWMAARGRTMDMFKCIRAAAASLVEGDERTERFVHGQRCFKVTKPDVTYSSPALAEVHAMQSQLPEHLRPVRIKSSFDVDKQRLDMLKRTNGEAATLIRGLIEMAENPLALPTVEVESDDAT